MFYQLDRLSRCLPERISCALDELPGTSDGTYECSLLEFDEEIRHMRTACSNASQWLLDLFAWKSSQNSSHSTSMMATILGSMLIGGLKTPSTCSSLTAVTNVGDTTFQQFSHFLMKEFPASNRIARHWCRGTTSLWSRSI